MVQLPTNPIFVVQLADEQAVQPSGAAAQHSNDLPVLFSHKYNRGLNQPCDFESGVYCSSTNYCEYLKTFQTSCSYDYECESNYCCPDASCGAAWTCAPIPDYQFYCQQPPI